MPSTRRSLLRAGVGVALGSTLAGCSGGSGDDDGDATTTTTVTTAAPTTTAGPRVVANGDQPMSIDRIDFAAEEPQGYGDLTPLDAEAIDRFISTIHVYFEPSGVPIVESPDGERSARVELRLRVIGPEGSTLSDDTQTLDQPIESGDDPDKLAFSMPWMPPAAPSDGTYTAEVTVTDRQTEESDTATADFSFVSPHAEYISEFKEGMAEEGVSVTAVTVDDGTVRVEYRLPEDTTENRFRRVIGYMAAQYAILVAEGWEASPFVATATVVTGNTFRWQLDRETGLAYVGGEISAEEFTRSVNETLRQV